MDLNIIIEEDKHRDTDDVIIRKIKHAILLGYKVIALTIHLDGKSIGKTIPSPTNVHKNTPFDKKVSIFTRLTVTVDDQSIMYKLSQSSSTKEYDIIAIQPLNEKIIQAFCSGNIDCDILTMEMSEKLPFDLKRLNLALPISRGCFFEINYSQALSSQSARINVISNGQLLVDKCRSKGIILSSGARSHIFLRSPHDVVNLGLLFELKDHLAKQAVFKLGQNVLRHANSRKNSASIAVTVESNDSKSKLIKEKLEKASKRKLVDEKMVQGLKVKRTS